MAPLLKNSLLLRLGLAMATITAFAFMGMLSSVIIAETTQGEAAAVNQAGSLRMQAYRIATGLAHGLDQHDDPAAYWRLTKGLVEEFEQRFRSPRLVSVLSREDADPLRAAYDKVGRQWHRKFKPILTAYLGIVSPLDRERFSSLAPEQQHQAQAAQQKIRERYLSQVDGFVAHIDHLVKLIEDDAESKIQLLRLIQVVSLFLTLVVVFITMYMMHTSVLVPLRELLSCAEGARRGDFSMRSRRTSDDELGQLAHAFNLMAEDLWKMYADLENRVREKSIDLERSNRSMELLYNTTKRLHDGALSDNTYSLLLKDIEKFVGVGPGTICLGTPKEDDAFKLATTRIVSEQAPDLCNPPDCATCLGEGTTHLFTVGGRHSLGPRIISIPIKDQERQYGVLLLEIAKGEHLSNWQTRLLEVVAGHIGIAIHLAHRSTQSRRLALHEERGVIARELHDSLAQSLSYLKIQASRLDAALAQPEGGDQAKAVVKELRDGISSAYRQLRELLTTFRLKMDGRGLPTALEETVEEFRNRSGVQITLDNNLGGCQLSANEEIHVLQVVREALSNVVRHAHASESHVALICSEQGHVTVTIDDNGQGLPDKAERRHHYGLAIMNERAASLHGSIAMMPRQGCGTRVELRFTPIHRTPPLASAG